MPVNARLRIIKGELPRKNEIVDWSEAKLMALLRFALHFIENDAFSVTGEKRQAAEARVSEEPFWAEFLMRIDRPVGKFQNKDFQLRLMSLVRVPLTWLKSNPHAVTEEMRALMEPTPRLNWALKSFEQKETKIGVPIVAVENRETTDPSRPNRSPDSSNLTLPEVQYNRSILQMTSILMDLTRSIKAADLKKMKVEDKIKHANAILQTLQKQFANYKPNVQVFKQINIHNAGRDDLEKAVLDYANEQ